MRTCRAPKKSSLAGDLVLAPSRGYFKLFSARGTAFRVHWSTPLIAVIAGGAYHPFVALAYLLVIVIHELGHAFFARRFGLHVVSIDVHGFGGVCRWSGSTTPVRHAIIAWGGIVFQLVLGAACMLYKNEPFLGMVFGVNLLLMIVNALPIPGLDGWEAWPLFHPRNVRSLFVRRRRAALRSRADELEAELAATLAREVEREKRSQSKYVN
jgi:stage IV sporulation protein FB